MQQSLKIKFLFYISLLIILAMGIATGVAYISSKNTVNRAITQQLSQLVVATSDHIAAWIRDRKQDLANWSEQQLYQTSLDDSYLGRAAQESASLRLKEQRQNYPYYESLNLANAQGKTVSSSDEQVMGKNISNQKFFQEAIKGKVYLSSVMASPDTAKSVFVIAVPVRKAGANEGVFYGIIDIDHFNDLFIMPIKIGKTGYVYVVGPEGVAIAHPDKSNILNTNITDYDWGKEMMQRGQGSIIYTWKGLKKIAFFQKNKDSGWLVGASAGLNEVFAPVRQLQLINLGITIIFIIVAIISVNILYNRIILKPMNYLMEGIARFGRGRLSEKITLDTRDEFNRLAESFNKMTDDLQKITVSRDDLVKEMAEREKAQNALRETEEKYRMQFERAKDAICIADAETGILIDCNPAVAKLVGRERSELIGQHQRILHPAEEFQGDFSRTFQQHLKDKEGEALETRVITKNGEVREVSIKANIFEVRGRKLMQGIFRDITERKNAEEALRDAYEKLKETQAKLVQAAKMASVGQLAGGVAHEINNPLTGVLNNVQLIKMMAEAKKDFNMDDFRELLGAIEESAVRCKQITVALLSFSHAATGQFCSLSINEVVKKVVTLITHEMKLQNIAIQADLDPNLPQVNGDPQLLQQVVFDLVSNAKWAIQEKSRKEGGVITIKTGSDPKDKQVLISVTDTGIGIPQENIDKIFEPFFTTKPVGAGTGLGLSIIYSIIKSHNGSISVESQAGLGATFKVSFPVYLE